MHLNIPYKMTTLNHLVTGNELCHKISLNNENTLKTAKQKTKRSRPKKIDTWKKQKLKLERHSPKDLPSIPDCGHCEKGMFCQKVTALDVTFFQSCFYKDLNKVKQDIFILRHCAVSAPKRCRSKDGIQRKSMVVHYHATTSTGSLVPVCRRTFTSLLGIKYGRVQGVLNRYIQSKRIPTENRGGARNSKKFQRKLQAICDFLASLQGSGLSCLRCGEKKTVLSPEYDMRKLWHYYNENAPPDLRVMESYFRNIFTKNFNISFGVPKDRDKEKDHCYRCTPKKAKSLSSIKKEPEDVSSEDIDLKILEMSYPPGEHFLFAPIPSWREPIGSQKEWRSGDEMEYEVPFNQYNEQKHIDATNHIKQDKNSFLGEANACPVSQSSTIHDSVPSNAIQHVYQPIHTHHAQLVNTSNSHIHPMSTSHNSNSTSIHDLHHQNVSNINIHSSQNYIIQPQTYIQLQDENSMQHQNGNNSFSNLLNGHTNTMHNMSSNHIDINNITLNDSNVTLNMNTSICNDVQCNVIHLGSHYESLNDLDTMHVQENAHSNELSNSNISVQPDYTVLSLSPQSLNNHQEQQQQLHQQHLHQQLEEQHQQQQQQPQTPQSIIFTALNKSNNSKDFMTASVTKALYRCVACRLTFSSRSTYYIHKKRHTDSKSFECEHCDRKFRRRDAFKQHLRSHSNTKPYRCEQCSQCFGHRINLEIHISRHVQMSQVENSQNKHKCLICLKVFTSQEDFNKHNMWHNKQPTDMFECDVCHKSFTSHVLMIGHKHSQHNKGKTMDCHVCQMSMPSQEELSKHIIDVHAKDKMHKCDICGLSYATSKQKNVHLRTHAIDKPNQYECKLCDKTYNSPVYLRRHTLTHSGERPFKCSICSRGFTRQYCLNRHLLYHSGMKPHECSKCGKRLADLRTLTNHMNGHNEEKQYECHICHAKFSFISNLKEHIKRSHKDQSGLDTKIGNPISQNDSQLYIHCTNKKT